MTTERNAQGVLSASERKALLDALDEPMTDDEAVGLIAELVQLTCAVAKVATTEQQKELTPKLLRAGNMVPYIANRLAAVAELVEAADRLQKSMPPSLVKQSTKNPNAGFIDWRDWIPLYAEVGELRQAIARVQGGEA